LGSFRVLENGRELTQEAWVSTKARDLLAYFVTFRSERIPTDRVFDALWRESSSRGKTAFHTALSRLRKALRGAGNDKTLKYILVEAGEYWLDTARFALDVDEFDASLTQARVAQSPADALPWYQKAIQRYQGEYLSGMYYDWLFPEQRRLMREYLNALNALADASLSWGNTNPPLTR
jgi:two-component SAPR family response regulator